MKYLLDTHTLIWNFEADPRLPQHLRALIDAPEHEIFISMASLWEMTVKSSLGKLTLSKPLEEIFQHVLNIGFSTLPIETSHLLALRDMPFHHRDPFDRLITAQCLSEKLLLLSVDTVFDHYADCRIW